MQINHHTRIGIGFIGLLTLTLTLARVTVGLADQPDDEPETPLAVIQIYLPLTLDQYGLLDRAFDDDGRVVTDFNSAPEFAHGVAVQSDGKIVAVGSANLPQDFALARYNPDGSLDPTFDDDGLVTTDIRDNIDYGEAVAIQSDGKIIVAGSAYGANYCDFALVRYNPDGSLDETFGGDGIVTTDFNQSLELAFAALIQPDGKIVVAGTTQTPNYDFAVARYNPDGSLDTTFSGDGKLTTDFSYSSDYARGVALQADGKLLVVGERQASDYDLVLARYNTNGTLDPSFDLDGKVITEFFGEGERGFAITVQPDGKIVAVGAATRASNVDFALARYNSDGSLDTSFNTDGLVTSDFLGVSNFAHAVVLQPDGKIVVAGESNYNFCLARYNPDGSLDTTFDDNGWVITDFGNGSVGWAVALQADGKIVVAGHTIYNTQYFFAVARFKSSLDASP